MHFRALVPFLLAACLALNGQTASVAGRVADSSGAVIPAVSVVITNEGTGIETPATTNEEGYFRISSLAPGKYKVALDKQGFKPVRESGLELIVGQVARLDYTLQVGAMTESVEVSARAVLLDSETSSLGQVIGGQQVTELPLLGRNAYSLAGLVPGVRTSVGMNDLPVDQISTVSASINGGRATQNEFLLDGAPNTAAAQNQPVIFQNVDSVQEFKVETNTFSAEYGRSAGGVFNVVTKSGTNDITFTAYEFLRNNALNANDFFSNRAGKTKAPFRFNQFGGVVGGPVKLGKIYDGTNRTFFFLATELVRFSQGVTWTATVPRPEQLNGDFTTTKNAAGAQINIFDPLTTVANPAGGYLRSPFPGNRIPVDRFDPVARNISKYWPAPNAAGAANTGVNNFVRNDASKIDKNTWSARLDHNLNSNNRLFGRFSYDNSPISRAPAYGADNIASPSFGPQVFNRYNTVVEDTHVFSPTLLGTFRAAYARLSNFRTPYSNGFDITTLGLPASLKQQIPIASFPVVTVTGLSTSASVPNTGNGAALGGADSIAFGMDNWSVMGSATKTMSRHTLKFGADYRVIRFNSQQFADTSTNFSFGQAFTQGPNPTQATQTAGVALATFLLGIPGGAVTPVPALAMQNIYYAFFLQEDWKVTDRLTLNLGLRYDFESPRTDRFDQLTNFDHAAQVPLQAPGMNLKGALSFVNVNGVSRYQTNPDRNNFSPRAGFAYRLGDKTVIRGGAGIFVGTITGVGGGAGSFGVSGFLTNTQVVTSLDGVTPKDYLRNPYPNGLLKASGSSQGAATLLGQAIAFTDRGNYSPYSVQWNFNIQRELPWRVLFDIGYAGSRGVGFSQDRQLNQLPSAALAQGDALRQQVPNPFYGQIAVGSLAQKTVSRAQLLRPYPHFDTVNAVNSAWATSNYNSLQVKIEKRYARGFTIMGSWTYSKLMDYGAGPFGGEALGAGGFQNWNDLASDWAVSITDQTHRFIINGVWALPFFRGSTGITKAVLAGWEIGAVNSWFSGGPIGIASSVNNTFSQGGGQRPMWNGVSAMVDNPVPDRWFNSAVFANAPSYTFGTSPRTFNGLRTDITQQIDANFSKTTVLREKLRLQFRGEFFNLLNTPRFSPPNASFGNPSFAVVSSQLNQPRIIQFGLKLLY
ncbi:MAG: TonB-dependent receptor [Acidobacteria bacterium]|nr:TonB-dependent receptor [Acidobacteriota bacterium]